MPPGNESLPITAIIAQEKGNIMQSFRHLKTIALILALLGVIHLSGAVLHGQPSVPGAAIPLCSNLPVNSGFCIGHPAQPQVSQPNPIPDCRTQPVNSGFCVGHPAQPSAPVSLPDIDISLCSALLPNAGFCIGS